MKEAEADLSLADEDNEEDDAALTLPVLLLWLFAVELEEDPAAPAAFFDCLAEEKMPSGTTRSRRNGIESIVFKLPSVDLVK